MSIREVLLPLVGEATRTTMPAIEKCVALACGLDVRVTASGFGHSRLSEHVWGGVTATVINQPPCWTMLSH
jgi:nucleotide-binding universal stress UspA family protein